MGHKCDGCRYKGEHQEMMFRPFGVCTKELNLIDAEKAYNAEKCPYKMTNADRIRAMSDEELVALMMDVPAVPCDEKISFMMRKNGCKDCQSCIMEWLQQPADTHDNPNLLDEK